MSTTNSYDIVILGAGPVGLMLSTHLARWGYKIKHIDNRPEPTATGRADGIQPRSLDLLKNMGLKRQIMAHEPARVYEVAFWDPLQNGEGIYRSGTWASCPKFIDARHPFTTLLHQGHIERVFIKDLEKNGIQIQRPWTITGFQNDGKDPVYPVRVQIKHVNGDQTEDLRAKYLFSGEGAKSFVREQLGIQIHHKDPIAHVWGVMDGVVKTNFPDIKMKCTIHSDHGSIMVIPREANMVRLYIQIASSTDEKWNPRMTASVEQVQASAKKTLHPYTIEWENVDWYSVYPIGQGIAERYTLDERVFMGGDACHTHSPKAGQGMNTAFLDAQNLAWKIHHVESGFAKRSILATYEKERKSVAENLLDFDAQYAKLFSTRQPSAGEVGAASDGTGQHGDNKFVELFKSSCEFTTGYGVTYGPNDFNWDHTHSAKANLFNPEGISLRTGRLLPPSTVRRVVDAYEIKLENDVPVNGSYRIYLFAGRQEKTRQAVSDFASNLAMRNSFYKAYEWSDLSKISHHEVHNPHSRFFTLCTIYANNRTSVEMAHVPTILSRYRTHVYADEIPDMRFLDALAPAHAKMGIDPEQGAVIVARPDAYVGCIVKLVEGSGTVDALNRYFNSFTTQSVGDVSIQARL